jgi:hypothetical protein
MKKFRLTLILVLGWLCVLALPALAQKQDFVLVNMTGYNVNAVKLSHISWSDWSKNVLGGGGLRHAEYTTIRFPDIGGQYWDIRVELDNGSAFELRQVDLYAAIGIVLKYRSGRMYYDVVTREDLRRLRESD